MNYLTESKGVEGTFLLHQLIRLSDQLQVEVALTRGMKEMETSRSGGSSHPDLNPVDGSVSEDHQVTTSDDSSGHSEHCKQSAESLTF